MFSLMRLKLYSFISSLFWLIKKLMNWLFIWLWLSLRLTFLFFSICLSQFESDFFNFLGPFNFCCLALLSVLVYLLRMWPSFCFLLLIQKLWRFEGLILVLLSLMRLWDLFFFLFVFISAKKSTFFWLAFVFEFIRTW